MIKGIIEHDREFVQSQITWGDFPENITQDNQGKWISLDPQVEIIETDLGSLFDQEIY